MMDGRFNVADLKESLRLRLEVCRVLLMLIEPSPNFLRTLFSELLNRLQRIYEPFFQTVWSYCIVNQKLTNCLGSLRTSHPYWTTNETNLKFLRL